MKQAIFITGFNNWGKTRIIRHFFNERQKYYQGGFYRIDGVNAEFTVDTHSNDDWFGQYWIDHINERISNEPKKNLNLFSALCPSMENGNNFVELLSNSLFNRYNKLHVFLIEYKWEHHAKLLTDNIIKKGSNIRNVNFIRINADQNLTSDSERWNAKTNQIMDQLVGIFL